jgi:hypothetical protein
MFMLGRIAPVGEGNKALADHEPANAVNKKKMLIRKFGPAALIVAFWICFCWPMLSGDRVVCYRDSAFLYWPLYHWIEEETESHGLPLWNPYENFGYSPLADTSSALLYPGKLIFRLPIESYTYRYGLYLSGHLLVASLGACWMARRFDVRPWWSLVAGISYGFSGPVVFQTTNIIFLVGAAWLPWAFGAYWMATNRRWVGWPVLTGMFLALMVLGGDPQMAFFALWVVVISSIIFAIRFWRANASQWAELRHQLSVPTVIVLSTVGLSAAQLVSTWQATRMSERARSTEVRNVWQAVANRNNLGLGANLRQLIREPVPGSHADAIYQFSQPPWTLFELLWPNVSGKLYPVNTRWIDGLPAADRMWHVSLYQGLFLVLFTICGARAWHSTGKGWLIGLGVFFLFASFGWYGLGWLAHELRIVPGSSNLSKPVGGVYWLMVTFLPGIDLFRYPAKVFLFVTLAVAVVGALNAPIILRSVRQSARSVALALSVVSITLPIGWLLGIFEHSIWQRFDWQFGPLVKDQAFCQMAVGIGTTGVLSLVLWSLPYWRGRVQKSFVGAVFAGLIILDIGMANHDLLPLVDQTTMDQALRAQVSHRQSLQHPGKFSLARPVSLVSTEWKHTSSSNRLTEIFNFQVGIGTPKFNLLSHQSVLGSFTSIQNHYSSLVINRFEMNEDRIKTKPIDQFFSALKNQRSNHELVCVVLSHPIKGSTDAFNELEHLENLNISRHGNPLRVVINEIRLLPYSYSEGSFEFQEIGGVRGFLIFPIAYEENWIVEYSTNGGAISAPIWKAGGTFIAVEIGSDVKNLRLYQMPLFRRGEFWLSVSCWMVAVIIVFLRRK